MHGFDDYLTKAQAAEVLNVKMSVLDSWRWNGRGPTYVRVGNAPRYSRTALRQFIAENTRVSIESEIRSKAFNDDVPALKSKPLPKETTEERRARLRAQRESADQIRRELQLKWDRRDKMKREKKASCATKVVTDVQG